MKGYLILRADGTAKYLTYDALEFDVRIDVNKDRLNYWTEKRIKRRVEEDNLTPGLYPMTLNKNGVKIHREVKDVMARIEKLSNTNYNKHGLPVRPGIKGCDNSRLTRDSAIVRENEAHRLAALLKDAIAPDGTFK